MIRSVVVAVPAKDEALTIGSCIRSIDAAAAATRLPTWIVVAADSCSDRTVEAACATHVAHSSVIVIESAWGTAAGTRAAASSTGISSTRCDPAEIWIANTDADSVVPEHWLIEQLRLEPHHDAVAGIVRLDELTTPMRLLRRFAETYLLDGDRHAHVHGANFGVRADAYAAVGGWTGAAVGEDVALRDRLLEGGYSVAHSTAVSVTTSARTTSRVGQGFAANLRRLVAEPAMALPPS